MRIVVVRIEEKGMSFVRSVELIVRREFHQRGREDIDGD